MNRILISGLLLFVSLFANAQNKKQLKEMYKAARDSGANYVILKGETKKREVKSLSFPGKWRTKGQIVFSDGEKESFENADIAECQTDDAFYKLCKYEYPASGLFLRGEDLAKRLYKATINIYSLSVSYTRPFEKYPTGTYFYLVEKNNDGKLVVLKNDDVTISDVKKLVSKSKTATSIIVEKIETKIGKWTDVGYVELQLLAAVKAYNEDAAANRLEL